MTTMEWVEKQVEIEEQRAMYASHTHEIYTIYGTERRVPVIGLRKLAKEIGKIVRTENEDKDYIFEFFEYKGIRFTEIRRKNEVDD